MNAARRSLLVGAHFLCPLLFFTNLTRNPYVTQIALLHGALALAFAAWAVGEAERAEGWRIPRTPANWPLAAFAAVWALSWARAYFAHPEFFKPAMAAEGARGGLFIALNWLAAFSLGVFTGAEDEGGDVSLTPWVLLTLLWALGWCAFPSLRSRPAGRPDELFRLVWDGYGVLLWAAGLGGAFWLCRRGRLVDFLHLAFAAGFLASIYGVAQYFNKEFVWPAVLNPYGGRAVSTFGNPNFLSTYNAALMPSALAFYVSAKDGGRRWVYGALFLALEAALLGTLTRSSWGGAAVGAAALAFSPALRARALERPRALGFLLSLGLGLALLWPSSTIAAGYTPTFIGRLTEMKGILERDGFYSPWHQRVLIWTSAWLMGSEEPWLGKGGGLFELFYPFYQGVMLHSGTFFHHMRTHANNSHNEVLEIFSQTGILGLGAYLWLWTSFFASARRWAREKLGEDPVWAGAVAGVAAVLVDNLLNVSLHFAVPAFMFWWLAGAAMGRGARLVGPSTWTAGPQARRAAAAAIVVLALFASWWQVRFWAREAWYFAGFKHSRMGNFPAAIRALERSRAWGPREVNAIYELGNAYARTGRTAEAGEAYAEALRANAGYDEIYFNLGTVRMQQGKTEEALPLYRTSWSINPLSNDCVNALVGLYLREPAAHGDKAEEVLAEAARDFPENPGHWNNYAYFLSLTKRWPEAEAAYERALETAPEFTLAERNLANIPAQSGRRPSPMLADLAELRALGGAAAGGDRSERLLARAKALAARRPALLQSRFLYGSLLLATRRPAEAVPELEAAAKGAGARAAPRLNLGDAYHALGRLAEAEAMWKAALSVEPGNAAAQQRLRALAGNR